MSEQRPVFESKQDATTSVDSLFQQREENDRRVTFLFFVMIVLQSVLRSFSVIDVPTDVFVLIGPRSGPSVVNNK